MKKIYISVLSLLAYSGIYSTNYTANPNDYTTYLSSLQAGDTLILQAGTYTNRLNLNAINGSQGSEIVITGPGTGSPAIFEGNPCCNTVSITQCSYITLMNFTIDGKGNGDIDGIKAEGSSGNWAHHITINTLKIVGHSGNQQTNGISTKCPAWNWTIRNCIIDSAGTGMYLGNSTGDSPFINGIIENNLITNTIGYNCQIKKENNGFRTVNGIPQNGSTIIRYNVFSKQFNASSGGDERPNLLVGSYPTSGAGANDYYEIYGNFFYQNPYEYLFQGTGNYAFYANVMYNSLGGGGMNVTTHDAVSPHNIDIFHNTIVTTNSNGIRLNGLDVNGIQHITNNAVFAPTAISGSTSVVTDNSTDTDANAGNYLTDISSTLPPLDCYPKTGQLSNCSSSSHESFYASYTDHELDFNGDTYNWMNCGAYTNSGINTGWTLQLDNRPVFNQVTTGNYPTYKNDELIIYPSPASITIHLNTKAGNIIKIFNVVGETVLNQQSISGAETVQISNWPSGIYFIRVINNNIISEKKITIFH